MLSSGVVRSMPTCTVIHERWASCSPYGDSGEPAQKTTAAQIRGTDIIGRPRRPRSGRLPAGTDRFLGQGQVGDRTEPREIPPEHRSGEEPHADHPGDIAKNRELTPEQVHLQSLRRALQTLRPKARPLLRAEGREASDPWRARTPRRDSAH